MDGGRAYARWANKRLPGEMEWEKASGARAGAETAKDPDRSGVVYIMGPGLNREVNTLEFWDNQTGKEKNVPAGHAGAIIRSWRFTIWGR